MAEDLGAQERAVLRAVSANPHHGQTELAKSLGVARSTVAARIAQLTRKGYILGRAYVLAEGRRIVCIGGATLDRKYIGAAPIRFGTSNPADSRRGFGGVARNVAETLARLGATVSLASRVGDDVAGRALIHHLQRLGVDTSRIALSANSPTAEYAAILGPDGELVLGIADMAVLEEITAADLDRWWPHLAAATWVFADCNLPPPLLAALVERRRSARFRLAVDAVSIAKTRHLPLDMSGIDLLVMNEFEAEAVLMARREQLADTPEDAARLLRGLGAAEVLLTLGERGLVVASASGVTRIAAPPAQPVDVTGAGDALIGGTLFRLLEGDALLEAVRAGALLAARTIETAETVHPALSARMLES